MAQIVKCPSCGENNPPSSMFCGGCGAKISVSGAAPAPSTSWPSPNSASLIAESLMNAEDEDESFDSLPSEESQNVRQQRGTPRGATSTSFSGQPTPPVVSPPMAPHSSPIPSQAPLRTSSSTPASTAVLPVMPSNAAPVPIFYEYQMIQVPPNIEVRGQQRGQEAARYLQNICNEQSANGWEFQRVDTIGVVYNPGCFGALFGARQGSVNYYVITFRRMRR